MATKNLDIDLVEDADDVVDVDAPTALAVAQADVVDEDINPLDKLPNHAIQNSDGSVTLPLFSPVTLQVRKGEKVTPTVYDKLVFHRINGADQRAISAATPENVSVVAFARTTRISQAVMNVLFDRLDIADISAGAQVLNSFTVTGRKTGK